MIIAKYEKDGMAKWGKAIIRVPSKRLQTQTYERIPTRAVSKKRAKLAFMLIIPCWEIDKLRVLQIIRSDHCTHTIEIRYPDWAYLRASVEKQICCWEMFE